MGAQPVKHSGECKMDEQDKVQPYLFRWNIRFCIPVLTCRDLGPSISSEYFWVIVQTVGNDHNYTGDRPWCKNQNYCIPNNGQMTPSCRLIQLWLVSVFLTIWPCVFLLFLFVQRCKRWKVTHLVWNCLSDRNDFLLVCLLWTVESLPEQQWFKQVFDHSCRWDQFTRVKRVLSGKLTFCSLKPRCFLPYKGNVSEG